ATRSLSRHCLMTSGGPPFTSTRSTRFETPPPSSCTPTAAASGARPVSRRYWAAFSQVSSRMGWRTVWRVDRSGDYGLKQGLEQQFEFADFYLAFEWVVGPINDGDRQGSIIAMALKLRDNASIFDLTLADSDLELPGIPAGVAEVYVLHIRIDGIELDLLV